MGILEVVFSLAKQGVIGLNCPMCPYSDVSMAFPVAIFAFKESAQGLMLDIHTRGCVCKQLETRFRLCMTTCNNKNCMCGKGKMHVEIMHILPLSWFMQESDNLAPDTVQGISGWHLAEWSLSVVPKAVQLALECHCLFSKSQTLSLQFVSLFLKTPNLKYIPL